jgi:3-isopropylmalate dehydratase small subunit
MSIYAVIAILFANIFKPNSINNKWYRNVASYHEGIIPLYTTTHLSNYYITIDSILGHDKKI